MDYLNSFLVVLNQKLDFSFFESSLEKYKQIILWKYSGF